MMPLFHIGGIMRNILSPILSGGSVITCSGFDPLLFWDVLYSCVGGREGDGVTPTWYYAAPTMHHALLQEAKNRPLPLPISRIRFIANAAGGLLPVLAESLRDTFQAVILTGYGMTECMPISSPPQSYLLEPTGTSGIPVGPEVIIVDEECVQRLPTGQSGNILVRGPPCFGGYENNGSANEESFFTIDGEPGWFNTGDMGRLDEQGYLFISGRSKEIINRGGETISPFEIEEAVIQHSLVKETLAFCAPHEQYQETVGAVVVTRAGGPRLDLPSLHKYLEDKLHRSKWPQVIVFMDALPKNAAGKILRIRLDKRLGLTAVDEESSPLGRLFEAVCPPIGTALTVPIALSSVLSSGGADPSLTERWFRDQPLVAEVAVLRVDLPARQDALVAFVVLRGAGRDKNEAAEKELLSAADAALHKYLVPFMVHALPAIPTTADGPDHRVLQTLSLQLFADKNVVLPRNAVETSMELIWRQQLASVVPISVKDSFFDIGGDSLRAGQLVAAMRKALRVKLSVADLFTAPTIEALAHKVSSLKILGSPGPNRQQESSAAQAGPSGGSKNYATAAHLSPFSNTSLPCLFVQLLPLAVVFPVRRIAIWFFTAIPWVYFMRHGVGRFKALLCAMLLMRISVGLLAPLTGIAVKWLVIGKYKAGRYPLWGSMYLRWWFVEQFINIMGKGLFIDDLPIIGPSLVRLYYVMMGASIGSNVKIHRDARIGQPDLLTIGDDVCIDNATIRAFALEEGHFVLLPIHIGARCSVAVKSVVAPGAVLPSGTCLGPLSSSHEQDDAEAHYRDYCRTAHAAPPAWMVLLLGVPILLAVTAISMLPWFYGLRLMVASAKSEGWYKADIRTVAGAFKWWITPQRLKYYFVLRATRRCLIPYIKLGLAILIKWTIIGRFTPQGAAEKASSWNRFRYWLMARLLRGGELGGVAKLVGTHYEIISIIYRALGAKVGKRVYWPGSGLDIVEYDLLEVGDDVVFGSRTVVLTSTASRADRIVFEAGSMVADRCVVLPGVRLRRGAVLGSGSLAAEGADMPMGSVWVGSQGGSAVSAAPEDKSFGSKDTITPFGRAFYNKQANFVVLPLWFIALYNTVWQAFCTCYRNCTTPFALILCRELMYLDDIKDYSCRELFKLTFVSYVPLYVSMSFAALCVSISAKWLLLGRRRQGAYAWDESSYCQRWQVYLTIEEIRRGERRKNGLLDMLQGSQYLVWYFRALGCSIGRNVCLYPNGGDPMMTEPDLVTLGDRAAVDDSSLVAHINTRGIFRLNPLSVGSGCVLKSMTRLLSGAAMEPHAVMQEHTLVLAGETVDSGSVWQGWPSKSQTSLESHRQVMQSLLDDAVSGAVLLDGRDRTDDENPPRRRNRAVSFSKKRPEKYLDIETEPLLAKTQKSGKNGDNAYGSVTRGK